MEQLGIKHLGRRLAYEMQIAVMGENIDDKPILFEFVGISNGCVQYHELGRTVDEEVVLSDCFPILRPLSDLTKEITHNGEKFVPIVEIAKLNFGSNYIRTLRVFGSDTFYVEFIGRGDSGGDNPQYLYNKVQFAYSSFHKSFIVGEIEVDGETITHCDAIYQLNCLEKLLSWHFRLDEPEGTWIDVNTLPKNPYE